ncbi:hypothetical protein LIA77_04923 [Sarocladium implicatum]|nr:hypothetical protein LIA77_04923 [Sarocladium implicatum]
MIGHLCFTTGVQLDRGLLPHQRIIINATTFATHLSTTHVRLPCDQEGPFWAYCDIARNEGFGSLGSMMLNSRIVEGEADMHTRPRSGGISTRGGRCVFPHHRLRHSVWTFPMPAPKLSLADSSIPFTTPIEPCSALHLTHSDSSVLV